MKGAYERLLMKPNCSGIPILLEMPVPWDDPTKNSSSNGVEWSQPELRVLQSTELEMGPKPFEGALKIMCGSQTFEQEAVSCLGYTKMYLRCQNLEVPAKESC